jgi:hypothetical protein
MKRFGLFLVFIFLLPFCIAPGIQSKHRQMISLYNSAAAGTAYTCVGWTNSNCTPLSNPSTESAATADRTYTRPYTATGAGTAVSILVYLVAWDAVDGYARLYRQDEGTGDSVLIGQVQIVTPTLDAWQEWTLSAVGAENLTFDADDVLYFGVSWDGPLNASALGREDAGGPGLYYSITTVTVSTPDPVTTWTTIAGRDMALILKYE